jgi:pyridoxal phosphate enzyme (YggS family)
VNAARPPLRARIDEIRGRIAQAARRSGRAADAVVLIAVVKQVEVDRVREAVDAGLGDLGENRVQEAEGAIAAVGRARARWHMVGHLQRNKAGRAVELFDRIHGIDSAPLAEALSRRAATAGRTMPVMVEVNVSGEASKFGVVPDALEALLARVAPLPHLALDGLMTVGAPVARPEDARGGFAALRGLRDRAERALGLRLPELSMGMSGDFEVAIEEGATMVRIGTALFGERASVE